MGGATGRTVSFHGVYRIDDGKLGRDSLCQLYQHIRKVPDIRPAVMHLRLLKTWNGTEKVLDSTGVTGHGMRL